MSKRTLVNLVFFLGVFFLMMFWAAQNIISIRAIEQPYTIKGDFIAASGVLPNAEVAYLGIHYGSVTKVDRRVGGVEITMDIDKGKRIPLGSLARIFRKSAIGEPYIDFQPPTSFKPDGAKDSDYMPTKDHVVPRADTRNPLEFSELLKTASALLANIDPNKAGTLVHELSVALNGRGDDLRTITISLDELSATFAAKTNVLDRLATNNTAITHVLATRANDLGQSLTNLRLVADALQASNGDTRVLLSQGRELVGRLADLVSDQKGNLDCTLKDLANLTTVAGSPAQIGNLNALLANGPAGFSTLARTIDHEPDGPWARVNLIVEPTNPAKQYVPPLGLPAVPAVPPCASNVPVGSGPDFLPSTVLRTSGGQVGFLPSTGGVALLSIGGALVLIALGARWITRGGRAHS
jgi:phospholipid/cholesterol/gamma-HCH transport system substrate-binding protein